ncbi:MAG TPA: NAD(P)-dependent oxidoreductase [Acetobacteraceae bacterium]|nr:NAD(P)-dependent oxidoreductase [Acetobacteraceae bacterium]
MIPIALDPRFSRLAVAGRGPLARRRYRALRAGGAEDALWFNDQPDDAAIAGAGQGLRRFLPDGEAMAALDVLWIVGLAEAEGEALATAARAAKVLVNLEDRPRFCDFHAVAEVRRGDLLLTISTNGRAPGLAGLIRRRLEAEFGPEWQERVGEIGAMRASWQREGVSMPEAARRIGEIVRERGWLPPGEKEEG